MARPNYLQCIMTPEIIRDIRQRQEIYDRDPERYEEQERQAEQDYYNSLESELPF